MDELTHHFMDLADTSAQISIEIVGLKPFLPAAELSKTLESIHTHIQTWKKTIMRRDKFKHLCMVMSEARKIVEILTQYILGSSLQAAGVSRASVEAMINQIESMSKKQLKNGVIPTAEYTSTIATPTTVSTIKDPMLICALMRTIKTLGNLSVHKQAPELDDAAATAAAEIEITPISIFEVMNFIVSLLTKITIAPATAGFAAAVPGAAAAAAAVPGAVAAGAVAASAVADGAVAASAVAASAVAASAVADGAVAVPGAIAAAADGASAEPSWADMAELASAVPERIKQKLLTRIGLVEFP
jgi:hypothetical protein